jgi:hypothetical protein
LGVPFLVSIFVLTPVAYYPAFLRYHLPETTDFNFFHFWWRMLAIGPWPSGSAWFLWVLLVLDAIAALLWGTEQSERSGNSFMPFAIGRRQLSRGSWSSRSSFICRCA